MRRCVQQPWRQGVACLARSIASACSWKIFANSAKILHEQGMWQEAEETYREVLDVQRRVLGHSHPDTLKGMAKLANALLHRGKVQETEEMHRDVLEGCAERLARNIRTHFAASACISSASSHMPCVKQLQGCSCLQAYRDVKCLVTNIRTRSRA